MKKFLLIASLGMLLMTSVSCTKSEEEAYKPSPTSIGSYDHEQRIADLVLESAKNFGDGTSEQLLVFSIEEFRDICVLEDSVLNIWTDEQLFKCMPVEAPNSLSYKDKLEYLRQFIPEDARSVDEGSTIETYRRLTASRGYFDATPDIVAQVIAASGEIVGIESSLNLWRPNFPYDNGQVTSFDVTRAISGVAQVSALDTAQEYDPESVVWEFEVSGGNWLIGATITTYSPAGTATEYVYGMNSPLGPLVWNPTLNSPADDDVIQGPLPGGIVSISANGLTPPLSVE